ncbi:MAG: UDP-N-acetylmuramoyl-L-alanine--D-glutamate ligase [Candidatus Thermofonsia Clade 3 bacterium]|uniref:UDP-N-acetylmuramoylalanine--D-glutamate ligase n=1 Tax=Candidatus Thermofonsia Clade 3 bacterium TaxID=2364212 RepID=A0A2M8QDG9_9CHLR|nr:MAG: UDP-N-acetylmuramoyl-L-alanine--D-glutamate ligase [Candidatus Thermofonsia Clade 3 bacterium]
MDWTGKQVVILGIARQGTALARYLVAHGARVTLSDLKPREQLDLQPLADLPGVDFVLGGHPLALLDRCDLLCLSGGVPSDLPIVQEARRRGIRLSNDAQVFFEVCPARIIGVTGSAGKTTTTTLIGEMLKLSTQEAAGSPAPARSVWVGGNIGNPLISDVERIRSEDWVVMELSSFQLELMTRSPHIACVTNITPNHLDRHGTMEAYIAAKRRILDFQSPRDWRVLSADNEVTAGLEGSARALWFSTRNEPRGDGAWMDAAGYLRIRVDRTAESPIGDRPSRIDAVICHRRELLLMGEHNVANVLAAATVCAAAGASVEALRRVSTTFRGVAHRLQLVAQRGGVRWYDDSIATTPERLMAALRCFDQPVILLCGGRDKHLPWEAAVRMMVERCKAVVLFGEMGPMVAEKLSDEQKRTNRLAFQWSQCGSLEEAVAEAHRLAQPGDAVLLSPGGTSYDAFKDFAERGDFFRKLVDALPAA